MVASKISFYLGLIFFVIMIIGVGLLLLGLFIIVSLGQAVTPAINTTISGIILVPIGLVFTIVFFSQAIKLRKKYSKD
ncbi:MAG: hypothetical protein GF353_13145 [Candidatus Lokiarchaeota archaeon]|nr:hypothetical protein [Candidatus Lokiarchaeota archaeon]